MVADRGRVQRHHSGSLDTVTHRHGVQARLGPSRHLKFPRRRRRFISRTT